MGVQTPTDLRAEAEALYVRNDLPAAMARFQELLWEAAQQPSGLLGGTVVVTGDHGELLGEMGGSSGTSANGAAPSYSRCRGL